MPVLCIEKKPNVRLKDRLTSNLINTPTFYDTYIARDRRLRLPNDCATRMWLPNWIVPVRRRYLSDEIVAIDHAGKYIVDPVIPHKTKQEDIKCVIPTSDSPWNRALRTVAFRIDSEIGQRGHVNSAPRTEIDSMEIGRKTKRNILLVAPHWSIYRAILVYSPISLTFDVYIRNEHVITGNHKNSNPAFLCAWALRRVLHAAGTTCSGINCCTYTRVNSDSAPLCKCSIVHYLK